MDSLAASIADLTTLGSPTNCKSSFTVKPNFVAIISNASLYFSSVYCDCNNLNLSEMAILTSSTSITASKLACKSAFKSLSTKYSLFSNSVASDKRLACCIDKLIKILFNSLNSAFSLVIPPNFSTSFGVASIHRPFQYLRKTATSGLLVSYQSVSLTGFSGGVSLL